MSIAITLQQLTSESLDKLFGQTFSKNDFQVTQTNPEFDGDYTVVMFSLVKKLRQSPDVIGKTLGDHLKTDYREFISDYNIIKGFLNLTISDTYWLSVLHKNHSDVCFGKFPMNGQKVMVEYSSPNTNKPLHLGHLRNNFLGWSVAEILKAMGNTVWKSSIVNDRGIHICKSMLAWERYGAGETPQSTGLKGDHLVGKYYVKFNDVYQAEVAELVASGAKKEDAEKQAEVMKETQLMLQKWEAGDEAVIALWKKMNSWVYAGFDVTYKNIGTDFDKVYYESDTYILGKEAVAQGLEKGVFFKKDDGSIWIDLTSDGLDEKLVLRKDGTSVYITQDIGLAQKKYEEYKIDKSIHVIGNEQDYHMKVLQLICKKIGLPFADHIHHLSYGMVELPTGKMKSREGTVVDADDIVQLMQDEAKEKTAALGKVNDFNPEELEQLYNTIGLGALKFFLLRIDPKKKMIFNPAETIDFHGFTAPFIQFNYARIRSILRKNPPEQTTLTAGTFLPLERELVVQLERYPNVISDAANELNPSLIAIYVFQLAKSFSSLYAAHSIASAETEEKKCLRLHLAAMTANVLKSGMALLGINMPERM